MTDSDETVKTVDPYKDDRVKKEPEPKRCEPGVAWPTWLYLVAALIIIVVIFTAKTLSSLTNKFMKLVITILITGIAVSIIHRSFVHCQSTVMWVAFALLLLLNIFLILIF